jgi:type IV secretory pathway TrbD component
MHVPTEAGRRSTPVYLSLLEPKMLAGVEDRLAILNATLGLAVAMGTGLWPWMFATLALHLAMARASRHDAWVRQVYIVHVGNADRYDPWPRTGQRRGRRPHGFGRDLLC